MECEFVDFYVYVCVCLYCRTLYKSVFRVVGGEWEDICYERRRAEDCVCAVPITCLLLQYLLPVLSCYKAVRVCVCVFVCVYCLCLLMLYLLQSCSREGVFITITKLFAREIVCFYEGS